jgi:hypothetical protein
MLCIFMTLGLHTKHQATSEHAALLSAPSASSCCARFMANLVMVQYIEQGPRWLAQTLQLIPSFNL